MADHCPERLATTVVATTHKTKSTLIFRSALGTAINHLHSLGVDRGKLLKAINYDWEMVKPDPVNAIPVPAGHLLDVYEQALRDDSRPDLGLCYGEASDVPIYGPLGYAMLSAATDIEAVNLALTYQRIYYGTLADISLYLEEDCGVVRLAEHIPPRPARVFFIESLLSGFLRFNLSMAGRPTQLKDVRLAYPDPGYRERYEAIFNCPVKFDCQRNELRFDKSVLAISLPNADPFTAKACEKICAELLEQFDKGEQCSLEIKQLLSDNWQQHPDMESIAQVLHCDVRTLRRRLSAENTSFQQIKDEVRKDIALDYLTSTTLPIKDIAIKVGFDQASNFRRAFRKWTGYRPSHFRKIKRREM